MTSSWTSMSCPVAALSISSQGSNCWVVDVSGNLYKRNSISWTLISSPSAAPLASVSAAADGSIVVTSTDGYSYQYSAVAGWSLGISVSLYGITSASIGDNSNMILVDASNQKYQRSAGVVSLHSGATGPVRISSTSNLAYVWGVSQSGSVYAWNGTGWSMVVGKTLRQVDVSLSILGTVQIVGVDASGNAWSFSGGIWTSIPAPVSAVDPLAKLIWIEAGVGYVWGALSNGEIFRNTF